METLSYVPSKSTQGQMTPRVLRAQFGDGYVQEAGDGINANLVTWEVVYDPIHASSGTTPTLSDLKSFFESLAGYTKFLWTPPPPYNSQGTFVCPRWEWVYDDGLIVGLRAQFVQRPTT
jgi:phage-related protein